nr:hypothetical protein VITISV_031969 [Ipomoea trifida]
MTLNLTLESYLYPHSLSYQATTLTMSSPITIVKEASMVEETSVHLKSTETRGASQTSNMPFRGPSAAFLKAALTSSAVSPFFSTFTTRSTTETLGVGTRSAMPLSFPLSFGSTRDTALAAPVLVGTMFSAAALALLKSLPGKLERVSAGYNLNKLPINRDRLVVNYLHVGFESSQHGIILQQVSCLHSHANFPVSEQRGTQRPRKNLSRFLLTFLTPALSFTTMTSSGESLRPCQQRRKFLPMRPKPLIATFNLATVSPLTGADTAA